MKESSGNGGSLSDPLQEAMRRIQDVEKTGSNELDLSSLGLGPVLGGDWDGWGSFAPARQAPISEAHR